MYLSVVIPVYKGAATIGKVADDCFAALSHVDFEIILVDDGSGDTTEDTIFALAKKHANVKAISLAKNVGEHNAVMCGLNFATGEYTAIIDDDGQNPPAEILKLLAKAEQGYDVVYAKYSQKMHSWWRNAGSWLNNFLAWIFIGKPFGLYLSSFKVMKKGLVAKVAEYQYGIAYIDSFIFREYAKATTISATHKEAGDSRYSLLGLMKVFYAMYMCSRRKYFFWVVFAFADIVLTIALSMCGIYLPTWLHTTVFFIAICITVRQDYVESQKRTFVIAKKSF